MERRCSLDRRDPDVASAAGRGSMAVNCCYHGSRVNNSMQLRRCVPQLV